MAHIIASIERMEHEPPARAKKGKAGAGKGKAAATRTSLKVAPATSGMEASGPPKLTPKKRWVQLWSAHLQDAAEQAASMEEVPAAATTGEVAGDVDMTATTEASLERSVGVEDGVTSPRATESSGEAEDLRVKTPQHAGTSHLSPPVERSSPSTTASISPSAKAKDGEAPSGGGKADAPALKTPLEAQPQLAEAERPSLLQTHSSGSLTSGGDADDAASRKRSAESEADPLTESEKRRAERRRRRKSNWDVGDPRFGGSPASAETPANQLARFLPAGRPTWRHSNSMEMKSFPGGVVRSSFNNNPGRRGLYHSNSMPLDRSRGAGRPSRYGSYR